MKISGLLHAGHARGHGTRFAASVMAVLLSVSLVISLQPCCELFTSLFTQQGLESNAIADGSGHDHDSTAPVSGKVQDYCGHFFSSGMDLAKAVPAILKNPASSDGAVFAVISSWVVPAMTRVVSPPTYHSPPPSFRIYLRFLHLLI